MKKLLVLILAVILLALLGCAPQPPVETIKPTTVPTAAPTTEPTTEPITEPTTEPITEPTTEPTTVPTTAPPLVRHSGIRPDGTFDEGTWFIGDSLTCNLMVAYLKPKGIVNDAIYTGKYGAQITAFFDGTVMNRTTGNICVYRPEHFGMTYEQVALELGEQARAIYIMFGTNYTPEGYVETYRKLVDFLLENCPNATIHMQLIPWGGGIRYEQVNEWIHQVYDGYTQAGEQRVMLIDTFTGIGRCPLSDSDMVHLSNQGNWNWYNTLLAHAQENGLEQ